MCKPTKNKRRAAAALAAAGFGALMGAQAVHGDFAISVSSPIAYVSDGINYSVYVVSARNNGLNGTGDTLGYGDVIIDTPGGFTSTTGALGIDVERSTSTAIGTYSVNVGGALTDSNGIDSGGQPFFGDIVGGTFVGIPFGGPFDPTFTNGFVTQTAPGDVFVNASTLTYTNPPHPPAVFVRQRPITNLDPQFLNSGTAHFGTEGGTTSAGMVDNGTIHSLESEFAVSSGTGPPIPDNFPGGVPFANVVVPTGTGFSIHGFLSPGPDGSERSKFSAAVGFTFGLTFDLAISLSGSVPPASNLIASSSGGGSTPQTFAVTGPAQSTGYLLVSGFVTGASQIYGLDFIGATNMNTLFSDLNTVLQLTNPGAFAEAPVGAAGSILQANGDNVELVFPQGPANAVLSYSLRNYTFNGTVTVTSITVIPEPASVGILIGGVGLLARRRSRRIISRG